MLSSKISSVKKLISSGIISSLVASSVSSSVSSITVSENCRAAQRRIHKGMSDETLLLNYFPFFIAVDVERDGGIRSLINDQ